MKLEFTVPVHTVSLTNQREHWAVKAERAKAHRHAALLAARKAKKKVELEPVLSILLVRIGARKLDSDNLTSALKSVRDGVADSLGLDDGSPLLRWEYGQEIGEPGVRVVVTRLAEG